MKLTYELITAWNVSKGFEVLFEYGNSTTGGILMRVVMFGIFVIIAGGLYNSQKNQVATGDFPQAMAVAGFVTSVLAIILRLLSTALIDLFTLWAIIAVTLGSFLWLLFSKD